MAGCHRILFGTARSKAGCAAGLNLTEPYAGRRSYVRSFGLDVTDPTDDNALESVRSLTEEEGFDLIIETSGVEPGIDFAVKAAAVRGRIVTLGFPAASYANYNVTAGIVKELSLIGSRVCTRSEFRDTLEAMLDMQNGGEIDFSRLIVPPRKLDDLAKSIEDVAHVRETAKILIRPE